LDVVVVTLNTRSDSGDLVGSGLTIGGSCSAADYVRAPPVQVIDPNQTNDVDRVAAATVEWSWIAYFLLILGAALAAASATIWFFSGMRFWSRKNHLPAN
jgi:hypothetical protein